MKNQFWIAVPLSVLASISVAQEIGPSRKLNLENGQQISISAIDLKNIKAANVKTAVTLNRPCPCEIGR